MEIRKISLSGSELYKGHLDRRILFPARQFLARLYESNNAGHPLFDIKKNRASFSYANSNQGLSQSETPLTGDMKGSRLYSIGSAPYSWVKEIEDGKASVEDTDKIIDILQKMSEDGKAVDNLVSILETESNSSKELKKIREELETPDENKLRECIIDLEREYDLPSNESPNRIMAVREYLEAIKQFRISHQSAFALFNKIWGAKGMFSMKR